MLGPSVAQWHERQQEIVLKNDPGCARQGVEVERNRAQTRIALTNSVDRPQQGVFKRFSFFSCVRGAFSSAGTSCSCSCSGLGLGLGLGLGSGFGRTTPNRLERTQPPGGEPLCKVAALLVGSRRLPLQAVRVASLRSRERTATLLKTHQQIGGLGSPI
jgi:hypothetical protein